MMNGTATTNAVTIEPSKTLPVVFLACTAIVFGLGTGRGGAVGMMTGARVTAMHAEQVAVVALLCTVRTDLHPD